MQGLKHKDTFLQSLGALGRGCIKLCAKDSVPESAGYAKSVLKIRIVMLEMVLLESLVVRWQTGTSQYDLH